MYTEDEAKGKYCCDGKGGKCCASMCMAWRWADELKKPTCVDKSFKSEMLPPRLIKSTTNGYCGLAGKP